MYRAYPALRTGSYRTVIIRNRQIVFSKDLEGQTVYVCLNLDDQPYDCQFGTHYDGLVDVLGGEAIRVEGENAHVHMEPFSSMILVHDNIENLQPEPKEEPEEEPREIHEGQHYRHFKGGRYTVLGVATHSETLEEMVVYRNDDDGNVWVRPKAMFMDKVNDQYRFTLLDD